MLQSHTDPPSDEKPRPPPAADWLPPGDGLGLGIIVGGIALFGDFVIAGIGSNGRGLPDVPLIVTMFMAWITAGLGLLMVWLGIGGGRLYLRLLVVGVIGTLLVLMFREGRWTAETFATLVLFLAGGAAPFGLLYLAGFELMRIDAMRPLAEEAKLRRGQFSMRQLFGWTVAATLLASVARFAPPALREWIPVAIASAIFSLIAVGAVCAALMPGGSKMLAIRFVILGASAVLLTGGVAVIISGGRGRFEDFAYLAVGSLMHVFLMSSALWAYRRLGYRMQRRERVGAMATNTNPSAS